MQYPGPLRIFAYPTKKVNPDMKGILLAAVLAGGMISAGAQEKLSTNRKTMKTHTSTIRLIYPQWQGGNVAAMVPEVKDPDDAARGY